MRVGTLHAGRVNGEYHTEKEGEYIVCAGDKVEASKATSTGDGPAVVNTHFRNREEHKVM